MNLLHPVFKGIAAFVATCLLSACSTDQTPPSSQEKRPTNADVDEFIARVNRELPELERDDSTAGWVYETNINEDNAYLNARATVRTLEYYSRVAAEAKAFDDAGIDDSRRRALKLIRLRVSAPAPASEEKRAQLAVLASDLDALYSKGKYCPSGRTLLKFSKEDKGCKNFDALDSIIGSSRDYDLLLEAWVGWHSIGKPIRPKYEQFVELANDGARALGFGDVGELWRSRYDMPPGEFSTEFDRLYEQVKPLYQSLHCYARAKLAKKYGAERVPAEKAVPAHLFGNMWAQWWNRIYDDVLKPYPEASIETADRQLQAQHWDAVRMTKSAESFYTSIGFPALPQTFWERSMLTRPKGRDVVCHPSAWSLDGKDDVRIKLCLEPTEEKLYVVYHELGHNYYALAYKDQPAIYKRGAQDGFHEAIGDAVKLSITPGYLHQIGLVSAVKPSHDAVINQQMKMALDTVAFLPFTKLVDEWRWGVFSGRIKPTDYNKAWWELREKYQGVSSPVPRNEENFDPGAKYHIPANTPYARYFLALMLQFQFHKALCDAASFRGPLHECSIYGNKEAGAKYNAMMALGASQPWSDTLEKLTGTRQMDASAIIEYFAPLKTWLDESNKGQACGW